MAIFDDGLSAGYGVLNHAAVRSAAVAEDAIEHPHIELRARGGRGGGRRDRRRERRITSRQSLMKPLREREGVAMSFVVHVHHMGRHVVEVVVQTRDLKPI